MFIWPGVSDAVECFHCNSDTEESRNRCKAMDSMDAGMYGDDVKKTCTSRCAVSTQWNISIHLLINQSMDDGSSYCNIFIMEQSYRRGGARELYKNNLFNTRESIVRTRIFLNREWWPQLLLNSPHLDQAWESWTPENCF